MNSTQRFNLAIVLALSALALALGLLVGETAILVVILLISAVAVYTALTGNPVILDEEE